MAAANTLPEVLETTEAERLATGFIFTEGPPAISMRAELEANKFT